MLTKQTISVLVHLLSSTLRFCLFCLGPISS